MSFTSWLRNLRSALAPGQIDRKLRRRSLRAAAHRPNLELLEDRCTPSFSPAVSYPTGMSPHAVLTADLNGDGRLDLAVANYNNSDVSVLLGNADGTFQPALTSATGLNPQSVAVGDFNADGKLDLATANAGDVSVLRGNGDGTFQAPSSMGVDGNPQSLAVGDFNADGKMDLGVTSNVYFPGTPGYWAGGGYYPGTPGHWGQHPDYGYMYFPPTSGYWSGGVYYPGTPGNWEGRANVLLGNGDGSFSLPNTTRLGSGHHTSAAVADFNGDGKQDFATANDEYGTVSVLLGTGTGALGVPTDFNVGFSVPKSVAAGDVNGDGKLDLVTANQGGGTVSVLLGNGLGSFGVAQGYAVGANPSEVAVTDFNRDGKLDLVTANENGTVSVLLGNGDGAFQPARNYAAGARSVSVTAGDFNGDLLPDLAVANINSNNVSVLLNDGIWPALDAPSISINDVTVTEGNIGTTAATFTVSLSAGYGPTVSIHYATADSSAVAGSDYQAASGTLTFAPGGPLTQTVTVLVNGDRQAEYTEAFLLVLTDPTNAFVADATGVGTIVDDEPTVSFATTYLSGLEGNTGTTPFTFTVTLSAAYDAPVTVDFATADFTPGEVYWYGPGAAAGVDYTATSGAVTFAPGGPLTQTITVLVIGDRFVEPDESFFVNLSNPTSAHLGSSQAFTTIVDDEPYVSINDVTKTEGNSGTTLFTFTVSLLAAYDLPVTVNFATADGTATAGSDYQAASGTLTIPAGQTSGTITVLVNGDGLVEPNETFFVNLSNLNYGAIADGQGWGTIVDDEPRVSINDVTKTEGNSGTTLFTFTVSLSVAYDLPVTVGYATANGTTTAGSDYQAASGTLTIPAGQTSGTINVLVNGDRLGEPNETFFVNLSNLNYGVLADSQGLGTIVDDEPRISISDVSKAEGKKGQTTLFTFTVTLSAAYDQAVTMSFKTVDGTAKTSDGDYVARTGTLTFAAGETSKTITIVVKGDSKMEANETFYLDLYGLSSNGVFTKSRGLGTILNDD